MKKILTLAVMVVIAAWMVSCTIRTNVVTSDDKDYTGCYSEERTADSLSGIYNYSPCAVILKVGNATSVKVEGNEPDVKAIRTILEHGTLNIDLKPGKYRNFKARIIVTAPTVNSVTNEGSGKIICSDPIICDDICSINTEGSGGIRLKCIVCRKAEICTSGSGSISISDETQAAEASATVNGSGSINMNGIYVSSLIDLTVNGSGNILANGKTMDTRATINGSGNISGTLQYFTLDRHINGSGHLSIKKRD